ncbi:hypothetical protein I552_3122 [Mycobacterium xenopi 3993]|nr:hypothetical protein I552_3122 [Mycobacterium xenopi 3993]
MNQPASGSRAAPRTTGRPREHPEAPGLPTVATIPMSRA